MADRDRASPSALGAGLRCRCPRCGRGPLFDGLLTVAAGCRDCGLDLRGQDSADGPASFAILLLGVVLIPLVFGLERLAAPPVWVHLAIWPLVVLALAIAVLRPLKATLIALQYRHRRDTLDAGG